MPFLRVVEVLPPAFPRRRAHADLDSVFESFVEELRPIGAYQDLVLVASLKSPGLHAVSTVATAHVISMRTGMDAAAVIVARDANSREVYSSILGARSLGLGTVMLAWGDRGPGDVHDLPSLAALISGAKRVLSGAGARMRLLAPVDLTRLTAPEGVRLARGRLRAGADLLLAQPPTTDPDLTMDQHLALLDSTGLRNKVLLSVFPFRDGRDASACAERFGWKLPRGLLRRASRRGFSPVRDARDIVGRLRAEGSPGVYLSTRGNPDLARQVLG